MSHKRALFPVILFQRISASILPEEGPLSKSLFLYEILAYNLLYFQFPFPEVNSLLSVKTEP